MFYKWTTQFSIPMHLNVPAHWSDALVHSKDIFLKAVKRMDGWMLFNDASAQFRPFSVLEQKLWKDYILFYV